MELTAILHALLYVPAGPEHDSPLVLFTDSQYCKNAITVWMDGWRSTGWKTAVGAPVKNVDLFEKLDAVMQAHQCWREVEIRWVRGHSGVPENELVDQKANHGRTTGLTNWKPKDNKHYPHVT
jgi:ribonuclease HI